MSNDLKKEKSPYLLQHKDNPVWWKPWGTKAFQRARDENKIIFLSIGYATCHWCHVMEKECFEDLQVAEELNRDFVCIKVDREELPEVDQIYMHSLHAMGQRGGWPLNMFLTPDLRPFYGGTYFPKGPFLNLLDRVALLWRERADQIRASSDQLTEVLRAQFTLPPKSLPSVDKYWSQFRQKCEWSFDSEWGGFSPAPKFPPHSTLSALLRLSYRQGDREALKWAERTLQKMAFGGLNDHIGGGFARYSVDDQWEIPHFEKMLYVNALLARNYLEAFQVTGKDFYLQVARETLDYLLRDMRSSGGGFFSAEDADSEGHEGVFYVWRHEELRKILSEADLEFLETHFGVTSAGNFDGGTNHLWMPNGSVERFHSSEEFRRVQQILLKKREERERPFLDDKQLTSWNGLVLSAMAAGARVTGEAKYRDAAVAGVGFIKSHLWSGGRLLRRYRDGEAAGEAGLEDYSYLICGLLDVHQLTFDPQLLSFALELQLQQENQLKQPGGAYFMAAENSSLIVRPLEAADGALPSANAVSAENLIRLSHFFPDQSFLKLAEEVLSCCLAEFENVPTGFAAALLTLDRLQASRHELIFQTSPQSPEILELGKKYLPDVILNHGREIPRGKKYQLCDYGLCHEPTDSWSQIEASILRR